MNLLAISIMLISYKIHASENRKGDYSIKLPATEECLNFQGTRYRVVTYPSINNNLNRCSPQLVASLLKSEYKKTAVSNDKESQNSERLRYTQELIKHGFLSKSHKTYSAKQTPAALSKPRRINTEKVRHQKPLEYYKGNKTPVSTTQSDKLTHNKAYLPQIKHESFNQRFSLFKDGCWTSDLKKESDSSNS